MFYLLFCPPGHGALMFGYGYLEIICCLRRAPFQQYRFFRVAELPGAKKRLSFYETPVG